MANKIAIQPLRLVIGLTILAVCLGIPVVRLTRSMIQRVGWTQTVESWGWSLLFPGAVGLSVWLILTALFPVEKSE